MREIWTKTQQEMIKKIQDTDLEVVEEAVKKWDANNSDMCISPNPFIK